MERWKKEEKERKEGEGIYFHCTCEWNEMNGEVKERGEGGNKVEGQRRRWEGKVLGKREGKGWKREERRREQRGRREVWGLYFYCTCVLPSGRSQGSVPLRRHSAILMFIL